MNAAGLFGFDAFDEAHLHHASSPWRRLVLGDDPDTVALRAVLERCWQHAGDSRPGLRAGLAHSRWGQYAGALGQLLALGLMRHEGFDVTSEPRLSGRTPDLLIERLGRRALVEVRALTGRGLQPWDDGPTHAARPAPPTPRSKAAAERARRADARRAAARRAEAEAAQALELGESVARALARKASTYAELCAEHDLPLIVALYEDTDDQLAQHTLRWLDDHTADDALAHLAGVLVFGRAGHASR